ncbi:MAG: PAS domain S-box protein [Kofleriaceae bacterium]|nr:PAS domain S-box protein [Kofleriaceae bacterium]
MSRAGTLKIQSGALRALLSSNGVRTWAWLVEANKVEWSDGIDEVFGLAPGQFEGTYEAFLARVHPDDRAPLMEAIGGVVAGHAEEYALEHRIVWPNGAVHWIACRGKATRENGRTVRIDGSVLDVTSRRATEEALRESEARFRAAMEHSPIGMAITAPSGAFIDVNPAACALWGYTREELLATDFQHITHPDDLERDLGFVRDTLSGARTTYQVDKRYIRRDGRTIWAQLNISLVRDGDGSPLYYIAQIQDVSARRAAVVALGESEAMLRQIAENLRVVVWLRSVGENRMLYISPRYDEVFGQSRELVIANMQSWLLAVHPEDRPRLAAVTSPTHAGGFDDHFRVMHPDGEVRWVHGRTFAIRDASGHVYRIAGTAEDVTEQRRIDEQLRHAQKLEAFGQLAGGVAHDFNNILACVLPHAELWAREEQVPAEVRDSLHEIGDAARRAATLTRQLLQLGRRDVLQPRQLELNAAVTTFLAMFRRVLRADIALRISLAPSRLVVFADPNLLDQVLMNLAVNARDAMPDGGTLEMSTSFVELDEIEARALPDATAGRYACFEIKDTGEGIPSEHLPRLFEPFFTTKPAGKGTGLGLATVFGIVKQHRGVITVTSEPGFGTTFRVLIPEHQQTTLAPHTTSPAPIHARGDALILVVEDEPAVRRTTELALGRHGYRVVTAPDGYEALRILEERGDAIDLMITDVVMPGPLGGRELVARLKARNARTRFILTSGYSADLFGHELPLREGENFLAKPASVAQLLDAVARALA